MRRLISSLHRYIGLVVAVLLVISGITGTVITFSREIDRGFNPGLRQVEPQSLGASVDSLAASARQAWSRHPVRMIVFSESPKDAVEIWYKGSSMRVYANPYSGQVIGMRDTHDSLLGLIVDLHINLLLGDIGKAVIGWSGLATMTLIILGIWLWWPKRGRWRQAFTIKWEAAAVRVWLDVHKLAGILAGSFIVAIAATGSALALYDVITEPLFVTLTGEGATRPAPMSSRTTGSPASLDLIIHRAKTTFPDGRITRLIMPAAPQDTVAIRMRLPGEIHQLGRTFIFFDPYDGTLLRADSIFEANLAARINSWFYPLHTGFYGGVATRLLHILFGLSLTLISLSGCWMWARNRIAKKWVHNRKHGTS